MSDLKPKIVIEHLMDRLWRWLYIEYIHSIKLVPDVLITNLPKKYHKLFPIKNVSEHSVSEIYPEDKLIILDPQARYMLTPNLIKRDNIIVIGGILGVHPPLGRTMKYLTLRLKSARAYNIGRRQLSIDGCIYVVKKLIEGYYISEIEFIDNYKIITEYGSEITLPFRYPLVDSKPLLSPDLYILLIKYGVPNPLCPIDEEIWGEVG